MREILKINKITKIYKNKFKALDELCLSINEGEIFALLGPNGAGKSTLINTVCGILNFDDGNISVNENDIIKDYRKARSIIGIVPQELNLEAFETVWDNVNYSRGLYGKSSNYKYTEELLKEWHWKERFSAQPENLRYLNYVAEKFDLRKHMQFNSKVDSAHFDETLSVWNLKIADGRQLTTRFLIMGVGLLAAPTYPRYEGMNDFKGLSFHTYHWPHEAVSLEGKKVAVIGTGATGIQVIGAIAPVVGTLTVFQRRPNWVAPLNNGEISEKESHHPDIWFGWGYAKIKIFTHAIKGLHESDFILAAKVDQIS